jgi:hypothetical protein
MTLKPQKKVDINDNRNLPFAKLKNYRVQDKKDNNTNTDDKVEKKVEKEYNRNIFINLGKISNFSFLQKKTVPNKMNGFYSKLLDGVISESELQKQPMNYSEYKRLLSLSKKNV